MYHYVQSEPGLWTVGTGTPASMGGKDWNPVSDHGDEQEAAERVRYLNGGPITTHDEDRIAALEAKNAKLRQYLNLILEVHPDRNDKANYAATVRQLAKMGLEAK